MLRKTRFALQFGQGSLGLGYDANIPDRKMREQEDHLVIEGMRRRLDFYDYDSVHPAKQLAFFIVRHLRKLPNEWQNYYHDLFRAEYNATRGVNKNWDQFCYVHDGYRKAKWVLAKYGQVPDEGSIPEPYYSQWANATAEERAWAYRRSFHLKELQALQRETCHSFGSVARDRSTTIHSHLESTASDPAKAQTGNNVHAEDLPAPREKMVRDDIEMSEIYMMTIQDDKQWNPLLKKETTGEAEFWGFEDEEDEDDFSPSAASARRRRDLAAKKKKDPAGAAKHEVGYSVKSASSDFTSSSGSGVKKKPNRREGSSNGGGASAGTFIQGGGGSEVNEEDEGEAGGMIRVKARDMSGSDVTQEELMKQEMPPRPTGGRVPTKRNFG